MYLTTYCGKRIDPLSVRADDIEIVDIAHALSHICRFGGHTKVFYSVAQHCVRVAELVPPELGLAALLHDATEAYLCDLPRPLRERLPGYAEIEKQFHRAIAHRFFLPETEHEVVTAADDLMLLVEAEQFTFIQPQEIAQKLPNVYEAVAREAALHPGFAKERFLYAFTIALQSRGAGYAPSSH